MKRMALAAAALIASLGLIAPSVADACERRRPVYGYRYQPAAPTFSLSFGSPSPVVVYRDRPARYYYGGGHPWGPPRKWRHRYYDD